MVRYHKVLLILIAVVASVIVVPGCASTISDRDVDTKPAGATLIVRCEPERFAAVLAEMWETVGDATVDRAGATATRIYSNSSRARVVWSPVAGGTRVEVRSTEVAIAMGPNVMARVVGQQIRETLERKQIPFERVL